MVNNSRNIYQSPLKKANAMELDNDDNTSDSSIKNRTKYTNIKNEINYDTTSMSSTYKKSSCEQIPTSSQIKGGDNKNVPWTTITPNNELYIDWNNTNNHDNSIDHNSKGSSTATSAVELVVAVKSAIQLRQDILDEWKKKAEHSISELNKLKKDKVSLEDSIEQKDQLITKINKDLVDIQNQYNTMNDESNVLKKNYESNRLEKDKLNSLYQCALQELGETRKKLIDTEEHCNKLDRRYRLQEEENEHWYKKGEHIEQELIHSKTTIINLRSEIVELEEKLILLQSELSIKSNNNQDDNHAIDNLKIKLTKSLDDLKREIDKNKSNSDEIIKLQTLIEQLENDKYDIKQLLDQLENQKISYQNQTSILQQKLDESKDRTTTIQQSYENLQSIIDELELKLNKYEIENDDLKHKINKIKSENDNLLEELDKSTAIIDENKICLNNLTIELDNQKVLLLEATTNINRLENEKLSIQSQLTTQQDIDKKRQNEFTRILTDNKSLKINVENIRKELITKNELLFKTQTESKNYQTQLQSLENELFDKQTKYNDELFIIQEKTKASNEYWKNYVEKEVSHIKQTYIEKLNRHCEEYSSIIAQSNSRDISFASEQPTVTSEIVDEIGYLKKQLNDSTKKLEEAISQVETNRKQMLEKSTKEQQQLIDKLTPSKNIDITYINDLESRIQSILSNFIDDNNILHRFEIENKQLKEKLEKYKKKYESNKIIDATTKELLAERDQLRIDLGHSKNLTSLAEESCDRLQHDYNDCKRKLDDTLATIQDLKSEQVTLQKNLGKKDAQINILTQTITNLKNKLEEYEKDSSNTKFLLENIEHDKLMYEKDIYLYKNEINELKTTLEYLKSSKKDISTLNEKLNKQLYELRSEITIKTNEITTYQGIIAELQQKLDTNSNEIIDLKNKLKNPSNKKTNNEYDFKELMDKFMDSNKQVNKLQQQLSQLTNDNKNNISRYQNQIKTIQDENKSKANEIKHLNELIQTESTKNKQLHNCVNTTNDILIEISRIFENYISFIEQSLQIPHEEDSINLLAINHSDCNIPCSNLARYQHIKIYEQKFEQIQNSFNILITQQQNLTQCLNEQQEKYNLERLNNEKKINSQQSQIEYYQKIVNSKQQEFEKIHQQLIDVQLLQSSQSDDLSKSICEHLERQRYALSINEESKNTIKNELTNVNRKMQNIIHEKQDIESKLQDLESMCSVYQVKIVTLEGEIENLQLKLKDSNERDLEQNNLINKITSHNRELNDQLLKSKLEIQQLQNLLLQQEHLSTNNKFDGDDDDNNQHCCKQNKCNHLHTSLNDLELQKQLLQEKLESSQKTEHMARLNMVSMDDKIKLLTTKLDSIELEKASLEGWVQHLQQMIQDNTTNLTKTNSSNRTQDKTLEQDLIRSKGQIKQLEIDNNHLKHQLDQLTQQISLLKITNNQSDQHKYIAERDEYEKKYNQIKKIFDEKQVEIVNLKSEINAVKQRYQKFADNASKHLDDTITTGSDISAEKRVTACVVTYSHKSDSKNSSFSRDSQTRIIKTHDSTEYKCDECDSKYGIESSNDQISQKMMPIIGSNLITASTHLQKQANKDTHSADNSSKDKQNKKKLSRRKKTIF